MEIEELLNLFDSYWFDSEILREKPHFPISAKTSKPHQNLETNKEILDEQPKLSKTPTFIIRSQSDQCLSSKDCLISETTNSPSPKSVLVEPKLQPILSGKEYNEFEFEFSAPVAAEKNCGRRKKKSNSSKSLSELEFEELKGFMDLGFEFSDKDKDSSLVTIIPGLRRLGRENEEGILGIEESAVSRPHLSEAWDVWEEEKRKMEMKKKNPLKSWRINPDFGNEIAIKDQLKFWAHTVASTVR